MPPAPAATRGPTTAVESGRMDERSERVAQRFELPILVAALLIVIAIEQSSLGESWNAIALALNWATWFVFALEVVVMLAVVADRRRWLRGHPLKEPFGDPADLCQQLVRSRRGSSGLVAKAPASRAEGRGPCPRSWDDGNVREAARLDGR
jgi:hypothetical protein